MQRIQQNTLMLIKEVVSMRGVRRYFSWNLAGSEQVLLDNICKLQYRLEFRFKEGLSGCSMPPDWGTWETCLPVDTIIVEPASEDTISVTFEGDGQVVSRVIDIKHNKCIDNALCTKQVKCIITWLNGNRSVELFDKELQGLSDTIKATINFKGGDEDAVYLITSKSNIISEPFVEIFVPESNQDKGYSKRIALQQHNGVNYIGKVDKLYEGSYEITSDTAPESKVFPDNELNVLVSQLDAVRDYIQYFKVTKSMFGKLEDLISNYRSLAFSFDTFIGNLEKNGIVLDDSDALTKAEVGNLVDKAYSMIMDAFTDPDITYQAADVLNTIKHAQGMLKELCRRPSVKGQKDTSHATCKKREEAEAVQEAVVSSNNGVDQVNSF